MKRSGTILTGLGLGLLVACGTYPGAGYADAMGAWDTGQRHHALDLAQAEYVRFRDGNDLQEPDVAEAAARAIQTLEDSPVVATGQVPEPPPDASVLDGGASELDRRLQADLLSGQVTATLRAIAVIRDLSLRRHARGLLTVVFRREAFAADGGVLAGASVALRSVACKRAALDALQGLER